MTRTVAVRLTANVTDFVRGTGQAAAATRGLGREVATATGKSAEAYKGLGLAASVVGAGVAFGLGKAVTASMGFEKSLSGLRAATGAGAADMDRLRAAALKVGEDTSLSASQAAAAATELAKAGLSTADILNGALTGAANLAAAGQLDMAEAAELAAASMSKFGLAGGDVSHIADLLSAGAGKAQGSVQDLGMALNQSGGIAAQMGFSLDETVGALAMFAEAGYTGSDAGTSFKQMMLSFVPASEAAAAAMQQYGLEFFDANGELKSFNEIADTLQQGLGDLTAEQQTSALKTIFGADAYRVAAVAMKGGSAAASEWGRAVDDTGHAARTASTMTDNLVGDFERLGGSIETALIENGSAANGVLRTLVQTADGAVGTFSDLPGPVQGIATGMAGLTGAVGLASGAFLLGAPKIAAFKDSLDDMGPRSQRFGKGILGAGAALGGPWGLAIAGGITALGIFAKRKADAQATVDAFTEAIQRDSGALAENSRATAAVELEKAGLLKVASDLGVSLDVVAKATIGDRDAVAELAGVTDRYLEVARSQGGEHDANSLKAIQQGKSAGELAAGVAELTGKTKEGLAEARRLAEATGEAGEAAEGAAPKADQYGQVLSGAAEQTVEMSDAQKALQEALQSWTGPLATYDELVQTSAQRVADSTEDAGDSWEDYKNRGLQSLDEFSAKLEAQNTAHVMWKENLVKVASEVGQDVAQYLAEMGEEGVQLTAELANGTDRETARAAAAIRQNMSQGSADATSALEQEMRVMALVGAQGAKATASNIASQLQIGVDRVAAIAKGYGVELVRGIDPVLVALGRPGILAGTSGRARNQVRGFAKGGIAQASDYALATGGYVVQELPAVNPSAVMAA